MHSGAPEDQSQGQIRPQDKLIGSICVFMKETYQKKCNFFGKFSILSCQQPLGYLIYSFFHITVKSFSVSGVICCAIGDIQKLDLIL